MKRINKEAKVRAAARQTIGQPLSYTIDAVCNATGLARTRIYAAIADGSLKSFLAGRRRMVSARALQDFIDALENHAKAAA